MSDKRAQGSSWLEYFPALIHPGCMFSARVDQLRELAANYTQGPVFEICLVALVAYFEAFCKDQFAAVINICPEMLDEFTKKRQGLTVELSNLLPFVGAVDRRLGSLLSEKYDFGSGKEINSLYRDLLEITPLSGDEIKRYQQLLDLRNLLVHHGGVFTTKYAKKHYRACDLASVAHIQSVDVTSEIFQDSTAFFEGIAKKIVLTSHGALESFIRGSAIELEPVRKEALGDLAFF